MAIYTKQHRRSGIEFYYVRFTLADGTRKVEKAGTTLKQAQRLEKKRNGEVVSGTYVDPKAEKPAAPEGPTFNDFADRFMRDYAGLRRSTYYTQQVKPLRAFFGAKRLEAITRADLDIFAAERSRQIIGKKVKHKISPGTVRKDLIILGTMFRMAVRWGVLHASPAVDLQKPAEPRHKTRYLERAEWDELQAGAPAWLRPILTVTIATGMRLKEVLGLRWEDVDRKAGLLYLSEDNKTATPRAIPIGAAVRGVLDQLDNVVDWRTGKHTSRFVFTDDAGAPYTSKGRNYVGNATKAAMKRAGIEGASFHTLRHTAGSWLAQVGVSEVQIAKLLGHASTRTTARYMHLHPDHLRDAVGRLDSAMLSAVLPSATCADPAEVAPIANVR